MVRRSDIPGDALSTASPKLRTPEAAHYVGLAKATLVKLRCVGGGPPFTRLGRAVIYEREDLDADFGAS